MERPSARQFGAMAVTSAALAWSAPALASDFGALAPYFLAAILISAIVVFGTIWGLTHFLPTPEMRRIARAIGLGVTLAPVRFLSMGIPDTYDSGYSPLGVAWLFDQPFNGPIRIVVSIAVTSLIFWGLLKAFSVMRGS